jgi:hypothetical protein
MDQQEAFNQVVQNMREQGRPCLLDGHVHCCFENKAENTHCAIGSMLSSASLAEIEERQVVDVIDLLHHTDIADVDLNISDLSWSAQVDFWEKMGEIHDSPLKEGWLAACEYQWKDYAEEAGLNYYEEDE